MNRLQRLSAILIQLQSGSWVRSQDIADRHAITSRTVYRDIQSLITSGVPIMSEVGKGYRLVDGYKLPPVLFTYEEGAALITAQKMFDQQTSGILAKDFNSALDKIKAVMKTSDKLGLAALENNIQVLSNPYLPTNHNKQDHLHLIITALNLKSQISIEYINRDKEHAVTRMVEPVGAYHQLSKWHIIGYCHLRKDYRDFRLDRVQKISLTHKPYTKSHLSLTNYLKKRQKNEELYQVVLSMKENEVKYLGEQKYYMGYVSQEKTGDKMLLRFLTSSLRGFAHWYMMIGLFAEIVEPNELKTEVWHLVHGMSEKMKA